MTQTSDDYWYPAAPARECTGTRLAGAGCEREMPTNFGKRVWTENAVVTPSVGGAHL